MPSPDGCPRKQDQAATAPQPELFAMSPAEEDWLLAYRDQVVVCDLHDGYTIYGVLSEVGPEHLVFSDCDLHDLREANSTKDVYTIETREIGVRVNRERCAIARAQLVAISRIDEVQT